MLPVALGSQVAKIKLVFDLDTYSGVVWALVGLSRCVPDTVGQ